MTTAIITLAILYIFRKPIRFVLDWCEAEEKDNWFNKTNNH